MYIIEITDDKVQEMSENVGKMLKYGSRLMDCLDDLQRNGDGSQMGERGGHYSNRYDTYRNGGFRDDDGDGGYSDGYGRMGMRRGVPGTGRYGR